MSNLVIPQGYKAPLPNYELQRAIAFIKESFQTNLSNALNLRRVSAPLFVASDSGLNDNLNGMERPVRFDIPGVGGKDAEVVHSLAKWKRLALKRYGFHVGKGLYTDMNAIRRDEDDLDNLHSVYVDQWDWEKIISREDRNEAYLKATVRAIVAAVCETSDALRRGLPQPAGSSWTGRCTSSPPRSWRTAGPDKTPKEREHAICARAPHRVPHADRRQAEDPAKSTTAVPPTMTTGPSTATFSCGTPFWSGPLRSPPWASGWMRNPWPAS